MNKRFKILPFLLFIALFGCKKEDGFTPNQDFVKKFTIEIDTSNPNLNNSVSTFETDIGVLLLPENYYGSNTNVKLVVYCHSGGGTVDFDFSEAESSMYCLYLASLGYAVLDVAGMPKTFSERLRIDHFRCMGSFVAVRSYQKAIEYVTSAFRISKDSIYLLGNSNGGLASTNLVQLTNLPIIAQAGIAPLLNLKNNGWNLKSKGFNKYGFERLQGRANIARIYDMGTFETQEQLDTISFEEKKVGNFDPFAYFESQKNTSYRVPFKIYHAKDDPIVLFDYSLRFANMINESGGYAEIFTFSIGGHTSEPTPYTIGEFSYLDKKYELTPTVSDVGKWFNKFGGYSTNLKK